MRHPELFALACAGCNAVFGITSTDVIDANEYVIDNPGPDIPDRDHDGVPDPDDPCIASIADSMADYDSDTYVNATDGCPFEYEFPPPDGDGDMVSDLCDPFPVIAGDRARCVMTFKNPSITRSLFTVRGDPANWNLLDTYGIHGHGTGALVAVERIEAPVTTSFEVIVLFGTPLAPAPDAAVTLWLRTNAAASASDVGCELRGGSGSMRLSLLGAPAPTMAPVPPTFSQFWMLGATIEPDVTGRTNVRCSARVWGAMSRVTIGAAIALPAGYAAFGLADIDETFITGMSVIERADAPPL